MYFTLKKLPFIPKAFDEVTDVNDLPDRWAQMYLTYLFHYELPAKASSKASGVIQTHIQWLNTDNCSLKIEVTSGK